MDHNLIKNRTFFLFRPRQIFGNITRLSKGIKIWGLERGRVRTTFEISENPVKIMAHQYGKIINFGHLRGLGQTHNAPQILRRKTLKLQNSLSSECIIR